MRLIGLLTLVVALTVMVFVPLQPVPVAQATGFPQTCGYYEGFIRQIPGFHPRESILHRWDWFPANADMIFLNSNYVFSWLNQTVSPPTSGVEPWIFPPTASGTRGKPVIGIAATDVMGDGDPLLKFEFKLQIIITVDNEFTAEQEQWLLMCEARAVIPFHMIHQPYDDFFDDPYADSEPPVNQVSSGIVSKERYYPPTPTPTMTTVPTSTPTRAATATPTATYRTSSLGGSRTAATGTPIPAVQCTFQNPCATATPTKTPAP